MNENLYLEIRKERMKQGLSQKQLGEMVGLPQQAINRIEQGQRKLDIELFEKLCQALKTEKIGSYNKNIAQALKNATITTHILYGDPEKEERMSSLFEVLNDSGQDKAIEQVELLTKIPEYTKKED